MIRIPLILKVLAFNALALSALAPVQAATQIGEDSGRVEWNGWALDYDMFELQDGLNLKNVTYNGVKILARANFPVMSVFYDGPCGPYADRLNGPKRAVPWANNATLVAREFTQAGRQWFELGIREFIGSYDIYQAWYLSADGELDGHLFSRGLQCNYFHEHYPMWRLDFDIDGEGNDQIVHENSAGQRIPYSSEFQANATDAYQHRWFVEDTVSGHQVQVDFDSGAWSVSGNVAPEQAYAQNKVGGVVARNSQMGWSGGASKNFPYRNGESLVGTDIAMWYSGYLPHSPSEGSALWHSTGFRISANLADDTDGDGLVNSIDPDDDNDGVLDEQDAFPLDAAESVDTDNDGVGNNADTDDDADGVADSNDAFPLNPNESVDTDGDGIGNNADNDDDGDGVNDGLDAFPLDASEQTDTDGDGVGNNADTDDDGDGIPDISDPFPLDPDESVDTDGDGIGNNTDPDDDNDGVADVDDAFPLNAGESVDTDGDGVGNNADTDDDNDGYLDVNDVFPLDPTEWADSDGDGIGDNSDTTTGSSCNILENGSFDVNYNGWATNTTPTIISDSQAGAGALSLANGYVSTVVQATANTSYVITGYTKATAGSGWAGLGVDFLDASGNEISEVFLTSRPSSSYSAFTLGDMTPAGTVFARMWIYAATDRSIQVDEIDIRPSGCTGSGGGFNQPPTVISPGDQIGTVGDTVNWAINASDREGASLSYTASNLPQGLQINSSTGRITGILTQDEQTTVTVIVSDGVNQVPVSFDWRVVPDGTVVTECNLLPNGGFEDGVDYWYSENATYQLINDAIEGQQAISISAGSISIEVAAQAGTNFQFTGLYRSTSSSNWSGYGIDYLDVDREEIAEQVVTLNSTSAYAPMELAGTVPTGAAFIRVWLYTSSTRTMTLDNLKLRDVSCGI